MGFDKEKRLREFPGMQQEGNCYVTVTNSGDNAPSSFGLGAQFMEKYLSVFVYPTEEITASVCFIATVPVSNLCVARKICCWVKFLQQDELSSYPAFKGLACLPHALDPQDVSGIS